MSRISFQDPIDDLGDRTPFHRSPDTSPKHDAFPPFLNAVENKHMTKLERLLRPSDLRTPSKRHSDIVSPKVHRQKLKAASPKSMRYKMKDAFEAESYVFDPLVHKGLVNLLQGLEKKIEDLGVLKSKSKGATGLALIRTRLKMRRKSDVSQWSGGVCSLEKTSSLLGYEYIPAIAVFDSGIKKENASPMLKNVFDTMMSSLRNKTVENNSSMLLDKRVSEGANTSSTITIVAPEMSIKACHTKDTTSLAIEDDTNSKKGNASRVNDVKDLLKTMGFGTNLGLKTRVVIVNIDKLKDLADFNAENQAPPTKPVEPSSTRGSGSRTELSKKSSEPANPKGMVELKLPPKDRRNKKTFSVLEQSRFGSPSLETSQDIRTLLKSPELKTEEDKEGSRLLKNVRIQTLSRKKLANIVNPPPGKTEKKKGTESFKSLDCKMNTHFDTQITEGPQENGTKKKKPTRPKGKKRLNGHKTFHGNLKLETNKSVQIQSIYTNNNLQIWPIAKPKKTKEESEEGKKHFGRHRKLHLSSTYTNGRLSPKLSPKKRNAL